MAHQRGWRDPAKERFWRKAVRGWQRSGLTIRAYCARNQLSENSFYAWRREIAWRDEEKNRSRRNPQLGRGQRREPAVAASRNLFMPVQVVPNASTAPIEIVLSSGRVLRVVSGFDRLALRDVVVLLEELSC
jgi:transposase